MNATEEFNYVEEGISVIVESNAELTKVQRNIARRLATKIGHLRPHDLLVNHEAEIVAEQEKDYLPQPSSDPTQIHHKSGPFQVPDSTRPASVTVLNGVEEAEFDETEDSGCLNNKRHTNRSIGVGLIVSGAASFSGEWQ